MEENKPVYHTIITDKKYNQLEKSVTTSDSNNKLPLMDELINYHGYSSSHYKTILFTCLILFIDGIHMTLINSTFIPFQKYYEITETEVSLISSTMFLAVGCGSLLTVFPDFLGDRRRVIIKFTFYIFLSNFLLAIFRYLAVFIIFRICIGVCIGVLLPLMINLICESLPIKNRSLTMICCGVFFGFGAMFVNILMLFFTPKLEKEGLYTVFFLLSIVPFVVASVLYYYLEDSPRSLLFNNREEEAFIALEKMIEKTLSNEEKATIISQIEYGGNNNSDTKLSQIFEGKFRSITIILIFIWMFNSYLVYGGTITFSLVLKNLEESERGSKNQANYNKDTSKIILDQIMVYLISSPGSFLAGFMTEVKIFGRKLTTLIGFLFVGVFCILQIIDISNFSIYFALSGFFISFSFNASGSYSSEVYPTKFRNMAVGFLNFCTRIAGFVSQFAAVQFFRIYYLGQVYFSIIICITACVITYSLPYDTHGRALDNDSFEVEKNKKEKIEVQSSRHIELKDMQI